MWKSSETWKKLQISSESDDGLLLDDSILLAAAECVVGVGVVLLLVLKLLLLFSLFFFFWTREHDFEHLSDCRFGFSALSEESASEKGSRLEFQEIF